MNAFDLHLGWAPLDAVHDEFVACVQALMQAPDAALGDAMALLEQHTREHFATEERWMAETDFPARECHAEEHAAVLASVCGVRQRVAEGDAAAARLLGAALLDWLPGHADYMDAALAHWMCKRNLGGTPVVLRRRSAETIA